MEEPEIEAPVASTAKAGGIVAATIFLSRVLGLVRDSVIAAQFGLGLQNDAYRVAIRIPDLIFMLIAGGGLSSAFIPVFSEYWHTNRRSEAWRVFSTVVTVSLLISSGLVVVAMYFAHPLVEIFAKGKPEIVDTAVNISRVMLPAQIAFLVGSVFQATLYSRRNYLLPGLAPNIYNIGIILGATALASLTGLGIVAVGWGALIGATIGSLIIPAVAVFLKGTEFRFSLDVKQPGVKKFFMLLAPVILGFSLPSVMTLITQRYASPFGAGANTVLDYATNLMQAPLGVFGQSMALAAFPVLSEFYAQGRMDAYREQLSKSLRTIIFLSVPASVLMGILAFPIVSVLNGYGLGNDPTQLQNIAHALQIYSFGIVAWCVQPILMRGFFSMHQTVRPIAIGTIMTGVYIGICEAIIRLPAAQNPFGLFILPVATNVAVILMSINLFVVLQRFAGSLNVSATLRTLLKSVLASIPLAAVAYLGGMALHSPSRLIQFFGLILVSLTAIWAYYFAAKWMRMDETAFMDRVFARLQRKSKPAAP